MLKITDTFFKELISFMLHKNGTEHIQNPLGIVKLSPGLKFDNFHFGNMKFKLFGGVFVSGRFKFLLRTID